MTYRTADHREMVGTLAKVTGLDINMHAPRLGKSAKKLNVAGYTSEQVLSTFGKDGAWFKKDWRGKQGQKPIPELVVEQISNLLGRPGNKYVDNEFAEFIES
jgi:hypothetical protein